MQEPCSLRPNCHSSCLWSCCSFSGRRHKEDVLVVLAMDAVKLGSHKGIWLVNCLRIVCKLCWFQRISYNYHVNNLLYAVTVISALITWNSFLFHRKCYRPRYTTTSYRSSYYTTTNYIDRKWGTNYVCNSKRGLTCASNYIFYTLR